MLNRCVSLVAMFLLLVISHQLSAPFSSLAKETDGGMPLAAVSASLQPDLFTGTLTGSIPIDVPSGRNGMQPNLMLSYASSGGNGWVGMGWKLEMGTIERQTRWGVLYNPTTAEEQAGKVYTFRLNGVSSDLVQDVTDPLLYHATIEGGFLRIKKLSSDGTAGWEVTDTKGTKYIFGTVARIQGTVGTLGTQIFKWCLERIEDRDGNFMTITYQPDGTTNQGYLSQINYTGNSVTGAPTTNTVKFYLEGRNDKPDMYTSNFKITTAKRLNTIEVKANGNTVRAYRLCYVDSASPCPTLSGSSLSSLLSNVQPFGKDATLDASGTVLSGTSLPAVSIAYDVTTEAGTFGGKISSSPHVGPTSTWIFQMADVNGDGKADAVATAINNSQQWQEWVALSNGDGTFGAKIASTPHTGATSTWTVSHVDVNGDGKADAVATAINNSQQWQEWVALSNGDGTFGAKIASTPHTGATSTWTVSHVDVNGDGKADAVATAINNSQQWQEWVALSNGDGTFGAKIASTPYPNATSGWTVSHVDVNGDGKADAVATAINNGQQWDEWVALSNGDGTFGAKIASTPHTGATSTWTVSHVDVNGDGKADAVATAINNGQQWDEWVALSNGDGTFGAKIASTPYPNATSGWTGVAMADVNGDGKADAVATAINNSQEWQEWVALALGGTDLPVAISNGLGGATTIAYTPSPQLMSTQTQLPYPLQTVTSLATCDNWNGPSCVGTSSTTTYSYAGGYHHIGERDFRGFKTATVTSSGATDADKTMITTWFHQGNERIVIDNEDPGLANGYMKGKPYRVEVRRKSDSLLYTKTETSYLADQIGTDTTAPWFNPPAVSTTSIYDSAGALVKQTQTESVTYDTYGNLTLAYNRGDWTGNNAITSDDTTTAVTYAPPDTTNWLIGFPTVTTSYAGLGTGGTKLSETLTYYDGASSCTTPAGSATTVTKGHVTKVERYLQGGTNPISGMEYNSYGGLTCTRDPKGNTTTLAYDPTSTFPLTSTNALGHVTTTSYYGVNGVAMDTGLYGQAKSVTDPNGKTTTTTYDALGRKFTATTPDGLVNTMTYNYGGTFSVGAQNIQSITSGGGLTTNLVSKTYFDGLGRTTKKESPGAADGGGALKVLVTETQYDVRGLVKQTSLPYIQGSESATGRWRTMTYDAVGRMIQSTNPDGTSSQVCYNGWTTTSLDPKLHKKVETKDALGRLITVQEYTGTQANCGTSGGTLYATTTYNYDLRGNLLSVTDAKGNVSTMTYDTLNRKLTMHDPDMGNWSYTYDANGNLLTQVDAKNQKLCFTYDALNRRTQKNYGTTTVACGTNTVVYAYDDTVAANNGTGRLKQVTDPAQSVTFQYDSRGRISQSAKILDGTTYTTTSAYDGLGRLTSVNYPTNPITTVSYTYDGPQLKSVLEGATTYVTYGGWNALGQPATATFGNGVVTTNTYANTTNTACTQQTFRLCTLTTQKGATPFYQDLRYDYEANGNVWNIYDSTVAGNAGDQHFAYDDLDRLTLANGPYGASGANASLIYQYDEIGNLTLNSQVSATAYGYPASGSSSVRPHAVSTAGANSYTYDNNGNMLTGAGRTYTWNQENKPLTIVQGGTTTTFVYDGDGGRVKKIVSTTTTRYISKLYECDNANCSRFVWAGSTRIATIASNGTVNYWHGDHLGSSSVITDATGNKVETITYYPFGGTRTNQSPSTPAIDVPYKYTGKELDASTGLYYYEARYYDATLARFISPDAIAQNPRDPQSENRYSYVGNNPLKYIDPTGHNKCFIGVCFSKKDIQTVKMVGTVVVVAAASYFTAGAASGLLQSALFQTVTAGLTNQALIGATIIAYAPTINAVGMIAGGLAGGAIGGAVGGAILGGDLSSTLRGAMVGGLSGAFAGGVGSFTQGWGAFGTISARGISGGVGSIIGGGRFEQGFASGLIGGSVSEAYQGMANETDWLKRKAGGPQFADMFGNLWTSGERGIEGGGKPPSIFGWITMGLESSGPSSNASLWDAFTNAVSKTHDFGNSWGYNYETGKSVNFGLLGNSLTDVWSMSTMVPAAAYTIGAMTNGGIAEGVARGLLKK